MEANPPPSFAPTFEPAQPLPNKFTSFMANNPQEMPYVSPVKPYVSPVKPASPVKPYVSPVKPASPVKPYASPVKPASPRRPFVSPTQRRPFVSPTKRSPKPFYSLPKRNLSNRNTSNSFKPSVKTMKNINVLKLYLKKIDPNKPTITTQAELRKAARKLLSVYHPDKYYQIRQRTDLDEPAKEKMIQDYTIAQSIIQNAYDELKEDAALKGGRKFR
jgi:hypothetical protein